MYLSCLFNGLLYYSREGLRNWKGRGEKGRRKTIEREIKRYDLMGNR
jgi:hypothetical protein